MRQLLYSQPAELENIVTDGLASYGPALRVLGRVYVHRTGRLRENSRAQNPHLPVQRHARKMFGFKARTSAQRLLTIHASIYNAFDFQ